MLGMELDLSFVDYGDFAQVLSYRSTPRHGHEQLQYSRTCAPGGLFLGPWTPFVTGGVAWAATRWDGSTSRPATRMPGRASARRLDRGWRHRLPARPALDDPPRISVHAPRPYGLLLRLLGTIRLAIRPAPVPVGLNTTSAPGTRRRQRQRPRLRPLGDPRPDHLHLPGLSADPFALEGINSLPAVGQSRETWTVSAFLGVAVAGRRALQSRIAAGLRHCGHDVAPGAIPTARHRSPTSPTPAQRLPPVPAPGDRAGRRARTGRGRLRPARRREGHQSRSASSSANSR